MNPSRIFEKYLIQNPEICNFCFRKKAIREPLPSDEVPDCVVPRMFPHESSELDYPPPEDRRGIHYIEIDYYFKHSDGRHGKSPRTAGGTGRNRPIIGRISKPEIVCECGRIDDYRINGEFPSDWESRPKEKLFEIGRRVYHRLDEYEEFDVDFDRFMDSLETYKTSDEYQFGDYEALEKSVADSVTIAPEND